MPKPNSARSQSLTSQESYSAIIIADLVAEVPVANENEKQETNLGFDGDTSPAMLAVSTEEIINKKNELSKGITLSPGQLDRSDLSPNEKTPQINNVLPAQVAAVSASTKLDEKTGGFKDMSLTRKIAFGASFMPSILFVLCFSIILPCRLPECTNQAWKKEFKNLEITSRIVVPGDVLFLAHGNGSFVQNLNESTGIIKPKTELYNKASYINCGRLVTGERQDCIIRDEEGLIYLYDTKNESIKWNRDFQKGVSSFPEILPDCDKDNIDEIALAVSEDKINVIFGEYKLFSLNITECDSTPTMLKAWSSNGSSSLIFVCEKNKKDRLVTIPQNVWCIYDKSSQGRRKILLTRDVGILQNSKIYPLNNELLLWAGEEVIMLNIDGTEKWKLNTTSHADTNRFIFAGKFLDDKEQIALMSSKMSSKLQVTFHDKENGKEMVSTSKKNVEVSNAVPIRGSERDFFLVLTKKATKTIGAEAYARFTEVSTTIISLLTNEEVGRSYDAPDTVSQELALMEANGASYTITETSGAIKVASATAIQHGENINVYMYTSSSNTTEISKIIVNDLETIKLQKCTLTTIKS